MRQETESSSQEERRPREGADDGADCVAAAPHADCDFNLAALHPANPIKRRTSAERTQASPERAHPEEPLALDPWRRIQPGWPALSKGRMPRSTPAMASADFVLSLRQQLVRIDAP
jgi:hypothetical protein